jgi:glycosyltransferase involved in cell wall biosynthesis
VPYDLAVLGQDPRFGGGGSAMTEAFLDAARSLGRTPTLLYDPHPGLDNARLTWRRFEALRQLAATRRLAHAAREGRSLWVVATLAQHGGAAVRSGRPYSCWVATTIASEWTGRAPGLASSRRAMAAASIPVLRSIERRVLHGAQALYATSAASCALVAAAAERPESEVNVLPVPIDTSCFYPADDSLWREALEGPVLTFVGRADDPRKNVGLLLDAFELIRKRLPSARLRLVGREPRGRVPNGVEIVGVVPDVAAELRRAAIFVLPSLQEGFGIVAAEALATGLPVVATPSGGPEELLTASGGGLVLSSFSADELAETIATLVADSGTASEMRASGPAYIREVHSPKRLNYLLAEAFTAT